MASNPLVGAIDFLRDYGFYDVLLPFLLVLFFVLWIIGIYRCIKNKQWVWLIVLITAPFIIIPILGLIIWIIGGGIVLIIFILGIGILPLIYLKHYQKKKFTKKEWIIFWVIAILVPLLFVVITNILAWS